jgi:hypothetical protein
MKRDPLAEARFRPLMAAAVILIAAAGCEQKIYEVDLRPRGDKIERRLTLTRSDLRDQSKENLAKNDQAELQAIARVYQTDTPSLPRPKASFSGTFGGVLPHDVGGDGHYVHWESPLGRVSVYVERFRGNDDINSSIDDRRKAVDSLVDLLVGWFESKLHGESDWPPLHAFLDKQFRSDVQNVSLLVWSTNVRHVFESTDALAEVGLRAAQYCVERKYAAYEEAPVLLREFQDASQRNNATALFARIRRLIVSHAKGATEARWKKSLSFLADSKTVSSSWQRYFVHSGYFKQHSAEVANEVQKRLGHEAAYQQENHAAEDAVGHLFLQAFPINNHFLSDVSRVRARLQAPRKPFWTNGSWNAQESRVEWSSLIAELPEPDREQPWDWPTLCFAAWDEPNEEGQKPIFGSVGLTGGHLLNYCLWYQGLSGLEKKEWDAFLATVKPGQPASQVRAFRFSNEPAESQNYLSVASGGTTLIIDALHPEKPHAIKSEAEAMPAPKAATPGAGGR